MVTHRVRIVYDDNADSPREADNLGTMCCWHRRYNLGDDGYKCSHPMDQLCTMLDEVKVEYDEFSSDANTLWGKVKEHYVILPLFLYDHSGLCMSTSSFSDPWDSGQVGFIYVSMQALRKEQPSKSDDDLREYATKILTSEVAAYDDYLRGHIYGFEVEERTEDGGWQHADSCYGFLGNDVTKNGMADYAGTEVPLKEAMDNINTWIEFTQEVAHA